MIPLIYVCAVVLSLGCTFASSSDTRDSVKQFLYSVGMGDKFDCAVRISKTSDGLLSIMDDGSYFFHYLILTPKVAADAKVVRKGPIELPLSCTRMVIVTHGWIDKGRKDWPMDVAREIARRVDPNEWICGYFDWEEGSTVINPEDAAKYARDIGGPRLARAILSVVGKLEHVHLIGHSAGSWLVDSAAKIISEKTTAEIHLTFLDAFVPAFWDEKQLGLLTTPFWADHYYTRDLTFEVTQTNLTHAHNIDITSADPWFKEHEFPYRWYYATIAGRYEHRSIEKNTPVRKYSGDREYGYARSLEAGLDNWNQSVLLPKANKPAKHLSEHRKSKE